MPAPMPRLLAIMGSGETAPTMVKVHRRLLERWARPPMSRPCSSTRRSAFRRTPGRSPDGPSTYFRESLHAAIASPGLRRPRRMGRAGQCSPTKSS